MKRVLSVILALSILLSMSAFSSVAYAAEYVAVYLNEKLIDFPSTDARPQIISNRTYVPVRKTCESLGLSIDWNSKTETMTLTRDGVTIAHTMRSKIVYVNGNAVTFDTPSINVNNRILMPIRMIAESIGATVEWDDPTRSVHITTNNNSNNNNNNSNINNVNLAIVNSISVENNTVNKNENAKLKVICSGDTTSVKFVDASNNSKIDVISKYVQNSDGTRTFEYDYKCVNETKENIIATIQAVPGIDSNFNENTSACKSVSFIILNKDKTEVDADAEYDSDYLISCKLTNSKIQTDDYAKVKVKTTSDVKKVKLVSTANNKSVVISDYDEDSDGNRNFSGKIAMTKEGNWRVNVYLYVSGDYEEEFESLKVSVSDDYDDDSKSNDLEIIDLWTNNSYAYKGYESTLYVKTSTDVDYIELLAEDQDEGEGKTMQTPDEKYSNYYYWEFDFNVKHTGDMKFKLLAFDEDGEKVSDSFTLEGRTASKNEPAVIEVDQKTNSLIEGETCKFNVTVTGGVDRLRVTRGTSSAVYDEEIKSTSSTTRTLTIEFEVDDVNEDYYFTAYVGDNYERFKFRLTGDVEEEIRINDVKIESDKISEDEDVELTVTTSNSAYRVWIEDSRGKQISKIYKTPDEEKKNELVWDISFSPIEDGRQTFTIVAQDENKKNDTWDFRVTVK